MRDDINRHEWVRFIRGRWAMITFERKIFILGCGGIVQCTLPLLFKHLAIAPHNVTIMDFVDNRARVSEFLQRGVRYIQDQITKENFPEILKKHLSPGDLFIDLAWSVDTVAMLEWCHNNGVLYINTSVEEWDAYKNIEGAHPSTLTLYYRQMNLQKLQQHWSTQGPTAIVDHGANPGLVSHFTKQALIEIATKILQEKPHDTRRNPLEETLSAKNFAELAQLTGTKVIHISERDTQIIKSPKEPNEFVNSWSVEGLIEEGMAPAELGWGTHERTMPKGAMTHPSGPQNQILLSSRGIDTWVRSWVPSGPIIGMAIRHGEAYGISDRLTVWKDNKAIYRPTVHYAYCPNDAAFCSLHELRMRNFVQQERKRIINDEITAGMDEVGCLLMGHDFNAWWIGSRLDISTARELVPHQNSTTVQVAIGVIAALLYAIKNPNEGLRLPDDIDHNEVLAIAKPYLGEFVSRPIDWTPISGPNEFLIFGKNIPKKEDMWQFSTFLVKNEFYKA